MFAQLTLLWLIAFADSAEQTQVPYHDLGVQFVDALKHDDIVAYAHCWMPSQRIQELALAAKKPIPKEELAKLGDYYRERNEQVAYSFPILKKYLSKHGKLEDIRLTEVSSNRTIRERDGMKGVSSVLIKIELAQQQFVILVDDAYEDGGKWFFTDKPMNISGSDNKAVSLRKGEK